jgi:hypothetical protein
LSLDGPLQQAVEVQGCVVWPGSGARWRVEAEPLRVFAQRYLCR